MMFGTLLVGSLAVQLIAPKITFQDGAFLVTGALGSEIVPVSTAAKSPDPVDRSKGLFRLVVGSKTILFDAKGLTVSQKGGSVTSRLRAVPTSGKVATKESNAELMKLVGEGKRKLDVSALSGWQLNGHVLYLLFRWEGTDKKPWLEALMRVNLEEKKPQAAFVGRFKAMSSATGIVDDVLFVQSERLAVLGNNGDKFGLALMTTDGAESDFDEYGDAVAKSRLMENGTSAWTLTPTQYGTNILGLADLDKHTYNVTGEVRGKMVSIKAPGLARFRSVKGVKVLNLMTGSEMTVEPDSEERQLTNGILLWAPAKNPARAALYDGSFRRLTVWAMPAVAKPTNAKPPVNKDPKAKPVTKPKAPAPASGSKGKPTTKTPVNKAKPPAKTKTPAKTASKGKSTKEKPKVKLEVTSRPSNKRKG